MALTTFPRQIHRYLKGNLELKGLDVIIPLTLEKYNQYLEDYSTPLIDLKKYQLPIISEKTSSHLMLLIGNTKDIWEPFLIHLDRTCRPKQGQPKNIIPSHPLDRYVKQSINETLVKMKQESHLPLPKRVYWVTDSEPGKMILAQRMALAAKAVSLCPISELCVHPVYGPWLAFRAALLFDIQGEEDHLVPSSQFVPPLCEHSEEVHKLLSKQMEEAIATARVESVDTKISLEAGKKWVLPRISMAPNHPWIYSSDQILYHYTKDLNFLSKVVETHRSSLPTNSKKPYYSTEM